MFPFGPRLNTVFASRWKALFWAAGVLLTAYCTVPSADSGGASKAGQAAQPPAHHNPWSLDSGSGPKG
jgi:hypothetical protein